MSARFSFAIDLGTSNSAIAIADLESGETRIIEIAQTLGPNQIGEMPTLPSATYIPHPEEFPESSFPLPWNDAGERTIIGQFARERGALVPDRLVISAKSWLSNPHIDPKQRILPWRADIPEEKHSPLECSRRYLQHLGDAFLSSSVRAEASLPALPVCFASPEPGGRAAAGVANQSVGVAPT